VVSLLRQSRGGDDYDGRFGHRMRGTGTFAELIAERFRVRCRQLGLNQGEAETLRTDLFQPPPRRDNRRTDERQYALFDAPSSGV
jgi:hypothetical protein